jgi:hypothetical protein
VFVVIDINGHTRRFGSLRERLEEVILPQVYYAHSVQDFKDNFYKFDADGRRVYALKPTKKLFLSSYFKDKSIVVFPVLRVNDEVVVQDIGRFFKFYDITGHFIGSLAEVIKHTNDPHLRLPEELSEGMRIHLPNFIFEPRCSPHLSLLYYKDILMPEAYAKKSPSLVDVCLNPV